MAGLLLGRLRIRAILNPTQHPNDPRCDHTSNWNSSISPRTSNFKIRSSFSFNVGPIGFFPVRVPAAVLTFLVVAPDGCRETTTPLLVVDELPVVALGFCTGTRGFIGLTCDVAPLKTTCFLGEIAFAVALDLTGRAVTAGFVTVVGRDVVVGRVVVALVVVVAVLTIVAGRVGLVAEVAGVREVEPTAGRILAVTSPREVVTGRTFVTGIFEGTVLDFTVREVGFGFDLEVDGSRERTSPSPSDADTGSTGLSNSSSA